MRFDPTPPAGPVPFRLKLYHAHQCDPKKCTGRRLMRSGLIEELSKVGPLRHSLFLDPYARNPLLRGDREIVERLGLGMLDCSWKHASGQHAELRFPNSRRLPLLVPVNPVNYGKIGLLTTAEALSGALYILGEAAASALAVSKFKWGPNFLVLNRDLLAAYAAAAGVEDVESIERGTFTPGQDIEMVEI